MKTSRRPLYILGFVGLLGVVAVIVVSIPRGSREGVFVVLFERDTVMVEQYRWRARTLDVESINHPGLLQSSMYGTFGSQSEMQKLNLRVHRLGAPDALPDLATAKLTLRNDTVTTELQTTDGSWAVRNIATRPDMVPYLDLSLTLLEEAIKRSRFLTTSTPTLLWFAVPSAPRSIAHIVFKHDSVIFEAGQTQFRLAIDSEGHVLGGSIPLHGLRIEHHFRPYAQRIAVAKPDYTAPKGAPYTAEEVEVTTKDGQKLAGTLTRPVAGPRQVAAVVLISGGGPQDRNSSDPAVPGGYRGFFEIADTLGRRGIAVLRLDDRGTGASTGDQTSTTMADYAKDIQSAVAFLRHDPRIDSHRIALLGHSEGGLVASMVAVADPIIRAIVLLAVPARSGEQVMIEQGSWLIAHDTSLKASERDSALHAVRAEYNVDSLAGRYRRSVLEDLKVTLSKDTSLSAAALDSIVADASQRSNFATLAIPAPWLFFLRYDPVPTALKVKAPVLLLHGESDRQVKVQHARELASAFRRGGNLDVTVRLFKGLNHRFISDSLGDPRKYRNLPSQHIRTDVLGAISDWLVARLDVQ